MLRLPKITFTWTDHGGGDAHGHNQVKNLINEIYDEVLRLDQKIKKQATGGGAAVTIALNVNGQLGILSTDGTFSLIGDGGDPSDV
jgi:hypothetical protein